MSLSLIMINSHENNDTNSFSVESHRGELTAARPVQWWGPCQPCPFREISPNQEITLSSPDGERKTAIDENGVLWGSLKNVPLEGFESNLSSMLAEPIRAFSVKMWPLGLGAASFSP